MSSNGKRRYITFKVDTHLADSLLSASSRRLKAGWGESCLRYLKFLSFCVVCTGSLVQAVGPWMLSGLEVLIMVLLYALTLPSSMSLIHKHRKYHYSYRTSLEDVMGFSLARALLLSFAYAWGAKRHQHRQYLMTAYMLGGSGLIYLAVKASLFTYGEGRVPVAVLLSTFGVFSILHIYAARRTVAYYRRRMQMGLAGFGYPWEDGEQAWLLHSQRVSDSGSHPKNTSSDGGVAAGPDGDLPPECLADPDSSFVDVDGVRVHYKEVDPMQGSRQAEREGVAIVLIHGFGAGVFCWRHIMEALAMQCHCRVVAFDRPGFGLTSRPELSRSSSTSSGGGGSSSSSSNPYTITAQAHLTMRLCAALGLEQVVLVGHADGALVALVAASLSGHHPGSNFSFQQQLHMSQQNQQEQQRWGSSYPEELTPKFLMGKISNMLGRPNSGDFSGLGVPLNDGTNSMRNSQMYTFGSSGSLPQLAQQQQQQQQQAGQEDVEAAGEMSSPGRLSSMTSSVSMQSLASMGANSTGAHAGLADVSQQAQELEPAAPQPAVQQQQQGYGLQQQRHAAGVSSAPGPPSVRSNQAGMPPQGEWMSRSGELPSVVHASTSYLHTAPGCSTRVQRPARQQYPLVASLVLLHPNMSGQLGPTFTRLLAKSKLGKAIMRPLLRTEIGEVSNRRAWHNTDKLTAEVLQLYKVPLRVHGWDAALVEITRCKKEYSSAEIRALCEMVCALPGLVVTGDHDKVVPPSKAEEVAQSLRHAEVAVVHNCGHLSHEEAPQTLLEVLVPFLGQVLQPVLLPLSAAHSMPQLQEQAQQQAWGEQGM